jgi:hypothetical protein
MYVIFEPKNIGMDNSVLRTSLKKLVKNCSDMISIKYLIKFGTCCKLEISIPISEQIAKAVRNL